MPYNAAMHAHLQHCRIRGLRRTTIYNRGLILRRFGQSIGDPLGCDHRAVLDYLAGRKVSSASLAVEVSNLRAFYVWCVSEGIRSDNPMTLVPRPRVPRRLPRPIPDDDLAHAIATAPAKLRRVLLLAAYAGLRACEIAPLRGEHLLLDRDPPLLVIEEGKGGGMSSVAVGPVLAAELRSAPPFGWLFPSPGGCGPVTAWWVSQWANEHLHASGTAHTLHSLRHWYGTQVLRACGNLRTTQEAMRHSSPVSTALYSFVAPAEIAAAVSALPALA